MYTRLFVTAGTIGYKERFDEEIIVRKEKIKFIHLVLRFREDQFVKYAPEFG